MGTNMKPLYEKVYESLKSDILLGTYPDGGLLPSEREIGEQHSVDRTTVRKALKMLVSDGLVIKQPGIGTKVTINPDGKKNNNEEKSAEEQSTTKTIGFFLPPSVHRTDRITQAFYSTLFYNAEKETRAKGYSLYYSALDVNDDFDTLLARHSFDGIVFVSNVADKFVQMAKKKSIPCVLANEYNDEIYSILADNINGMIKICDYLVDLGHRSFALITGISSYLTSQERLIGCTYSFSKNNIPAPLIVNCDWEPDTAYRVTKQMLLDCEKLPTAIVAFNDNIAFGCLRAANELGLRVPQDISIVGFDDIEQSGYSIPRLTTVNGNIAIMAKSAIQGLFNQMHDQSYLTTLKVYVPFSLVIRESAAKPPTETPTIRMKA
jgi:DNA-binding LacI/PurR family transcriptional regulator